MFLRFLMKLIKPTNEQLRHSKSDKWIARQTQSIYKCMLNQLHKSYLYYAIHDTITIDNGRVKIVHEFRDIEFENELKRNGIDTRPYLLSATLPFSTLKSKSKKWYGYFRFKDLFSVYIDDKEVFVKNDSSHSTSGTVTANIKVSSSSDIIRRSFIEIKSNPNESIKERQKELSSSLKASAKTPHKDMNVPQRKNIFERDVIHAARQTTSEKNAEKRMNESEIIEKRGFEIDTTF